MEPVTARSSPNRELPLGPGEITAEELLDRFAPPFRQQIRKLTCCSSRAEDLLVTFPGLAFALATGYGSVEARDRAFELIQEGRSLKQAASVLGLPWWLRKLPAEAFCEPLVPLSGSVEFSRRMAAHVPQDSLRAVPWLKRVLLSNELVDEEFALWIAWRTRSAPRMRDMNRFILLAAWAWYSGQPETLGHSLLRRPWDPAMGYRTALDEASMWKKRISLAVALGHGISDSWYPQSQVGGFEFVPLRSLGDFLHESTLMGNCLDQYGIQVSLGSTRVFSIRVDGAPVANVEIGLHDDDRSMPTIVQLRTPGNKRADAGVWRAVYAWLGSQVMAPIKIERRRDNGEREVARAIWRPFMAATARSAYQRQVVMLLKSGEVLDPDF